MLLTNRQFAKISQRRPATLTAPREVDGLGEAKASRFGRELLTLLRSSQHRPLPSRSPGARRSLH